MATNANNLTTSAPSTSASVTAQSDGGKKRASTAIKRYRKSVKSLHYKRWASKKYGDLGDMFLLKAGCDDLYH